MMQLGPTMLPFLGQRTYLHSTDVFAYFAETMGRLPADRQPLHLVSFKFLRETDRNGSAFLLEADEALPADIGKPVATLIFRDRADRLRRLELTDDGAPIADRAAEPPPQCLTPAMTGDFTGTVPCRLPQSPADLFYTVVEANKLMHVETLRHRGEDAARPFRFVYCEELPLGVINRDDGEISLSFRHRGSRLVDGRTYTLNVIQSDDLRADGVRICFAY